jgi:hypothetical protein
MLHGLLLLMGEVDEAVAPAQSRREGDRARCSAIPTSRGPAADCGLQKGDPGRAAKRGRKSLSAYAAKPRTRQIVHYLLVQAIPVGADREAGRRGRALRRGFAPWMAAGESKAFRPPACGSVRQRSESENPGGECPSS